MALRKEFLDQLRRLEDHIERLTTENQHLRKQVERQGDEAFEMAGAVMSIRKEDAERLAAFRKTNAELVQFVESIGDSESQYGPEARRILGL